MRRHNEEVDSNETDQIIVKVGRPGGKIEEYSLDEDSTVEDALKAADIDTSKGDRIRVNNDSVVLDDVLEHGDLITVAGKVAGA